MNIKVVPPRIISMRCVLCGVEKPEKGYMEGNIAVLCDRCNRRKNNMSMQDVTIIYNWMRERLL